jgi:hypothetical protein
LKEDKTDGTKDNLYEELEEVFHKFPKYHMKTWLWDFYANVGMEVIFKLTTGNESPYKMNNDNGVRVVNIYQTTYQKIYSS